MFFAQANRQPGPEPAAFGLFMLAFICLEIGLIAAATAYQVWYFIVKIQALSAVAPHNRTMEPAMIFLIFIPLFGFVWYFIVVMRIAESLEQEFRERHIPYEGDFGRRTGIVAGVLNLTCVLAPIGLIFSIMHLQSLRGYTRAIESSRTSPAQAWDDFRSRDDDYREPPPTREREDRIREL